MKLTDIENLLALLKQNEITDFELEQDGTKIKLQRGAKTILQAAPVVQEIVSPIINHANVHSAPQVNAAAPAALAPGLVEVKSPIVGTFYRKPSPDAELFVKEGDRVKKGDTLCIIEAMKLMNEIEAPQDGKVEKVLISDGKVVEYGEVMFLINPNA